MAYELMQTLQTDASVDAVTMDRRYYSVYQNGLASRAFMGHRSANASEIAMETDDVVVINHYAVAENIAMGQNNRTKQYGNLAEFKLDLVPEIQDFSEYKNVGRVN
jgi:hypothetical protein